MVTNSKGETKPLEDHVKDRDLHKMILENVLTVTKNFDNRVKFLRKSPLLASILASEPQDMVPRPQHEPLNMLGTQSPK